ncbi:MAG: methionine--tRNA ligase [Chitinivibrionales bacterium]|nr:methionine--tRNA ligase [Chitinivibrionales bacterium]
MKSRNDGESNAAGKTLLVTQALPYANGDIHLGHLVEAVQSDIFVRFQKLSGNRVLFVCADDTHGTPIELTALKRGITPEELIGEAWKNHVRDYAAFSIGFDVFHSTNSEENRKYAEYIYTMLDKKELIVEKEISQFYCEHDRRFLPDRFVIGTCPKCGAPEQYGDVCEVCNSTYDSADLVEPVCYICRRTPVRKTSIHKFVRLDKQEDFLRDYINNRPVLSDDMKNFVNNWLKEGLKEWCISRDGPYFGFKIPNTDNKFFYVWLDAPIGYISSTEKWCTDNGEKTETFWGEDSGCDVIHFIGKDIVYFHALFWPVMLHSAEINLPKRIFVHGFLTVEGEKMSKTRGTFVLARDFAQKLTHPQATEYLRFFYASKLSSHAGDIDLSSEEFCKRANTTLANNIGNLHHRTFVFCDRYFDGTVPDAEWDETIEKEVHQAAEEIRAAYETVEYRKVIEKVHGLGNRGNRYYQDSKPWELIKQDKDAAAKVMVTCANLVKACGVFLKPVVPHIVAKMERQFGTEFSWPDYAFSLRNRKLNPTEKLAAPIEVELLRKMFTINKEAAPEASQLELKPEVDIETFGRIDLRTGTIKSAGRIKKSRKLIKLQVEIGPETRQIVAGIGEQYEPDSLPGRQIVVVANLKPAKLMGVESRGMLLAATDGESLVLLNPESPLPSGARIS